MEYGVICLTEGPILIKMNGQCHQTLDFSLFSIEPESWSHPIPVRIQTANTKRGERKPTVQPYTSTIPTGGRVFHKPRVKSGKSLGRLLSATERSLNSETQLSAAAS